MTDKPLHVRVAEALGCKPMHLDADSFYNRPAGWYCDCEDQCPCAWKPPVGGVAGGPIADYPHDWSATGPLIERYGILVGRSQYHADSARGKWFAAEGFDGAYGDSWIDDTWGQVADGSTPLIAVCELILALAAAGKLEATAAPTGARP